MPVYRFDGGVCYDSDSHEYWRETLHGRRDYISVTQAIDEGGLTNDAATVNRTEESRERGTAVHDGLLFYFTYRDEPVLTDGHQPYFRQVIKFLSESGFKVERAEEIVADDIVGYAGCFDFFGQLPAFTFGHDMIDVKTGSMPDTVRQQTMGYRRRLPSQYTTVRRWALVVTPTSYSLVPLNTDPETGRISRDTDRYDERLFLAAVEIAKYRRRKGYTRSRYVQPV